MFVAESVIVLQTMMNFLTGIVMSRIITFNCVAFLLWQLVYLNFTNAESDILRGMIKDGEEAIHINWKKTKQLLANEHLPVWTATQQRSKHYLATDEVNHFWHNNFMKKNIGDFVFYQDEKKSSAIVHFKKTNTLCGYIDTRYRILDLPITESDYGHRVGGRYVSTDQLTMNIHDHLKPLNLSMHANRLHTDKSCQPSTSDQSEPLDEHKYRNNSHGRTEVTTFYPEILLFIAYDLQQAVKNEFHDNLSTLVKYYLIYFNAIDMLFAKLSTDTIQIYLNLAGIVIEDEPNVFSFVKTTNEILPLGVCNVDSPSTLKSVPHYINANGGTFFQDSFDYFFISTNKELWTPNENQPIIGDSVIVDIFMARQTQIPNKSLLGVLVNQNRGCGFVTTSRQIAYLMSINDDPPNNGYHDDKMQCYAIMQRGDKFCSSCLKWSDKSSDELKTFARLNRNRCFLLNTPRSLNPYGNSMKTLWPSHQCRCYGLDPRTPINTPLNWMSISPSRCNQNLFCGNQPHQQLNLLPLDGTPCAVNKRKVCWNKECRLLSS